VQTARAETPERERSRQAYIEACRARLGALTAGANAASATLQQNLKQAELDLFRATRRQTITAASCDQAELSARLMHELAEIGGLDKIETVRPTTEGFVAFTKNLSITHPDSNETIDLGRFLIWIRLVGNQPGVYWFNASRRIGGAAPLMNAPYVYEDGKPVAHEVRQSLCDLVGQFQLASAVDLAIQFVETADRESPFTAHLPYWKPGAPVRRFAQPQQIAGNRRPWFAERIEQIDIRPRRRRRWWERVRDFFHEDEDRDPPANQPPPIPTRLDDERNDLERQIDEQRTQRAIEATAYLIETMMRRRGQVAGADRLRGLRRDLEGPTNPAIPPRTPAALPAPGGNNAAENPQQTQDPIETTGNFIEDIFRQAGDPEAAARFREMRRRLGL
jgi:hypothetical protein